MLFIRLDYGGDLEQTTVLGVKEPRCLTSVQMVGTSVGPHTRSWKFSNFGYTKILINTNKKAQIDSWQSKRNSDRGKSPRWENQIM